MYEKECTSSVEEFIKENNFKKRGLTTEEAKNNLAKYGKNEMRQKSRNDGIIIFWKAYLVLLI